MHASNVRSVFSINRYARLEADFRTHNYVTLSTRNYKLPWVPIFRFTAGIVYNFLWIENAEKPLRHILVEIKKS